MFLKCGLLINFQLKRKSVDPEAPETFLSVKYSGSYNSVLIAESLSLHSSELGTCHLLCPGWHCNVRLYRNEKLVIK